MKVDVLLGLQWGDEGKGKIVDYLSPDYDIIARFQGGPNAGHTLIINNQKTVLHIIPSGIFREDVINVIGNGVVIDPTILMREIAGLKEKGLTLSNLRIARKAHLILPTHRYLDAASENAKGKAKIGSTLKGIGPTYMDKTGRNGLRVGDIFAPDFKSKYDTLKSKHLDLIKIYPEVIFELEKEETQFLASIESMKQLQIIDGAYYINEALNAGKRILAEGAQGSMLDIDYGTYPFVTSSNTVTAGVCTGLGVAPKNIGKVIGISKAYCTRVGSGSFPSELFDHNAEELQKVGHEFGATTGRPRRCGWIDIPQLKYTVMINGVDEIVLTKIDVLNGFETFGAVESYIENGKETEKLPYDLNTKIEVNVKQITGWKSSTNTQAYNELPSDAKSYISYLEEKIGVPISIVSVGPGRDEIIIKK